MTITTSGHRILSNAELNELRSTITDPNSSLAILLEMYDDSVGREAYEELEKENADLRETIECKDHEINQWVKENDALRDSIYLHSLHVKDALKNP